MQQNNWIKLLPLTQLAINNKIFVTTKKTSFRKNHGMDSNFDHNSKKISQKTKQLNEIWKNLRTNWRKSKNAMNHKNKNKKDFN